MGGRKPRQSDLRRAVSTAYYAHFHALCRTCADTLIGTRGAERSERAWRQAYRALQHGQAKARFTNRFAMKTFPRGIEDFGNAFVEAQIKRHSADYDPTFRVTRSEALTDIRTAEDAIAKLNAARIMDRRALAAWVVFPDRE